MIVTGSPVAAVMPGEGVELEGGDMVRAPVVVSNADPKRTLTLLDGATVPSAFKARVDACRERQRSLAQPLRRARYSAHVSIPVRQSASQASASANAAITSLR